ncbi:MAG TPA: magnesium transporter [Symbiobacteriaceae bacterium]|nr:magnesium transporter [Symbiobacteriaceae bacterium]
MHLTHEEVLGILQGYLETSSLATDLTTHLEEVQSYDLAHLLLEQFDPPQIRTVLTALDPEFAAQIVEHWESIDQYRLLHHLEPPIARAILEQMSTDAVVDLFGAIHPRQEQQLIELLPDEYAATIRALRNYDENTAGGHMTIDYVSVRQSMTVGQVLAHIRKVGDEAETIAYIYVVDSAGRLVGVLSLRELILAEPNVKVESIMSTSPVSVPSTLDQEEVARVVSQYDLVAIPVVSPQMKLVGIITVDDLVDVIHDEATEDIQKLGGSAPLTDSYFQTPVLTLVKKRIGWILVLFLAEAYTGTVLRHFEDVLAAVVSLSFFIPLLIGTGGNTGSQIVATLVRGLGVGEISFKDMGRVLLREISTGLVIGLIMGVATLIRAYTLGVGAQLGPVVALTSTFIVIWASIVSAVLPLVLHRLKVDPAVVSGPFITTLVDGTGLFLYFTIARWMLGLH